MYILGIAIYLLIARAPKIGFVHRPIFLHERHLHIFIEGLWEALGIGSEPGLVQVQKCSCLSTSRKQSPVPLDLASRNLNNQNGNKWIYLLFINKNLNRFLHSVIHTMCYKQDRSWTHAVTPGYALNCSSLKLRSFSVNLGFQNLAIFLHCQHVVL